MVPDRTWSEFMGETRRARLIGAPPGYVGL